MDTGIIDIGSNSVRLMWGGTGALRRKQIVTTQLSEGLDDSGYLSAEPMTRTAEAIAGLCAEAKAGGAKKVVAFATEAVRAAKNGGEFCRMVRNKSGLNIDVLDGITEAQCGFLGAKEGFDGRAAVLDIGGASVELVVGDAICEYARSLPLGVVRMKERYGRDYEGFFRSRKELLSGYGEVPPFDRLIAIGGTPTTVVAMTRGFDCYDPERVHGSTVTAAEVGEAKQIVTSLSADELMARFPTLVRRRATVIPYGVMLLQAILERFKLQFFTVSEKDNLEGYAKLLRLT